MREAHSAVLLPGCRVLVTGGTNEVQGTERNDAWIYDGRRGGWFDAGTFTESRFNHAAVAFPDGTAWVIGGTHTGSGNRASTERFDGTRWDAGPSLLAPRTRHTATVTSDGRVFVIGGYLSNPALDAVEQCPSQSNTCVDAGRLQTGRARHTASLLPDGRILVVGGNTSATNSQPRISSTELYEPNPTARMLTDAGTLFIARSNHVALVLDGGVLVLGGYDDADTGTFTVEWFDLATSAWLCLKPMRHPRGEFAAALLDPVTVLIAGGREAPAGSPLDTAELYPLSGPVPCNTGTGTATESIDIAPMNAGRARLTMTRLPNGKILVVGESDGGKPASQLYSVDDGWVTIP